jgi:hypothetical protein
MAELVGAAVLAALVYHPRLGRENRQCDLGVVPVVCTLVEADDFGKQGRNRKMGPRPSWKPLPGSSETRPPSVGSQDGAPDPKALGRNLGRRAVNILTTGQKVEPPPATN